MVWDELGEEKPVGLLEEVSDGVRPPLRAKREPGPFERGNLAQRLGKTQSRIHCLPDFFPGRIRALAGAFLEGSHHANQSWGEVLNAFHRANELISRAISRLQMRRVIQRVGGRFMSTETLVQENNSILKENKAVLAANSDKLVENSSVIVENKATLASNGATLAENKATLSENKAALSSNNGMLAENKATLVENKSTLAANAESLATNNSLLTENRALLTKNNQLLEAILAKLG